MPSQLIVSEYIIPRVEKYSKRLREIQDKLRADDEYISPNVALFQLRNTEFREHVGGLAIISHLP